MFRLSWERLFESFEAEPGLVGACFVTFSLLFCFVGVIPTWGGRFAFLVQQFRSALLL